MSVPLWFAELAEVFWKRARQTEPFPRNLRLAVKRGLPLTVIELSALSIRSASAWLEANDIVCELPGRDRMLRACLIARAGHGFAMLDRDQSEDEIRFSFAHEIAHFLKDYWSPRELAKRSFGDAIAEVLDGDRPPSQDERLHALLRNISLGFHIHLMERDRAGRMLSAAALESEANADRLAYELLAPAEPVLAQGESDSSTLAAKLRSVYGLPKAQASHYAQLLLPSVRCDPLILRLKAMRE